MQHWLSRLQVRWLHASTSCHDHSHPSLSTEAKADAKQKKMLDNPLGERRGRSVRGNLGQDGKYQWGSIFTNADNVNGILDRGDPNYDSGSDVDSTEHPHQEAMLMDLRQDIYRTDAENVKAAVVAIVAEYFLSGDISEVSASLEDLPHGCELMPYFVKRLVLLALDRKDREREMTSTLLSSLYSVIFPPEMLQKGFESIIESLDDTSLDVPDAQNLVALFIARAVCDDILPPSFVARISTDSDSSLITNGLKAKVEQLLAGQHSKILKCWGPGTGSAQEAKETITTSLQKFVSSNDANEVSSTLRALSMPFFHHELVKQVALMAIASPIQRDSMVLLLKKLVCEVLQVSPSQLIKGLQRVASSLDDLSLDDPFASQKYSLVIDALVAAGLLEEGQRNLVTRVTQSSDAGSNATHSLSQFKSLTAATIREYFMAADTQEVVRRFEELNDPGLLHLVVKQLIVMANERKDSQRELASQLLQHLARQGVLQNDQLVLGFVVLLSSLEDLILDCPDAVRLCSLFLARSIADGVLGPVALSLILRGLPVSSSLGINVVRSAGAILSDKHSTARLEGCWKKGFYNGQARELIDAALREFLSTKDKQEAARCLSELGIPTFHHEVVLRAVELSFEFNSDEKTEALVSLLSSLSSSGVVSATQMTHGFNRLKARLDQAVLDFGPHSVAAFSKLIERGVKEGWLEMS